MSHLFLFFAAAWLAATSASGPVSTLPDLESRWNALLETYVLDERWVDYAGWHANPEHRAELRSLVEEFAKIDPAALEPQAAIAFWINVYNAVTVDLVLDHYPLRSIKDIDAGFLGSPWKIERITIGDHLLTLDAIEHEILRVDFDEPRIHFALNCASVGCPPLAPEAFTAARLDEQLDAATERALHSTEWVDLSGCDGSYGSGTIRLTKLFDWFAGDFGGETAVREFLARYRPGDSFTLRNTQCALEYFDYDWTLNAPPDQRR